MKDTMTSLSDEELMMLYQSGETAAFALLFERHGGRVLGYLQKKAAPETARELLQETFLKLHRARQQYSAQYPFLPWLFTIARNALVDHARLQESRIAAESGGEVEVAIDPTALAGDAESEAQAALRMLPEPQRRALELRYLKEWSFEQIAADLRTSPTNARQLVSRGLRYLRRRQGREQP